MDSPALSLALSRPSSSDPAHGQIAASPSAALVAMERPHWLPEIAWPFPTSSIVVEGARIAVTDVGRGPTLLFVHTGFWSFIWRDVIAQLASDFRCVCFDAPGTGQSDRLPPSAISLARASRALTAVIDALDLRDVTLVVHDLGGPSGIAGAARVADRIAGLVGVNAFAWEPSGFAFRGMLALMGSTPMRELCAWTGIIARLTTTAFGVGLHLDPTSRRAFYDGIGRQGVRAFHGYLRDARRSLPIYRELAQAFAGPFRDLPVLTIFGEHNDPLGFQPRWRALYPDARQVVVRRGNHFPMCDDPALVATAIRAHYADRVAPRLAEAHPRDLMLGTVRQIR